MKTINKFKSTASYPEQAIVLIFDFEDFSTFFSQPDVHTYVPKYINHILDCMNIIISGGKAYWDKDDNGKVATYKSLPEPLHIKFLGDGMLYIWKYNDFTEKTKITFINRLWNFKVNFDIVTLKCSEDIPVIDIPSNIRFGISAGSVYKLTYLNTNREEFIGYSINLASRLQNYCKDLGFIISARVGISKKDTQAYNYKKIIATKIKGFPNEIVYIDSDECDELNPEIKENLFQELK